MRNQEISESIRNHLFLNRSKLSDLANSKELLLKRSAIVENKISDLNEVRAFLNKYLDVMTIQKIQHIEETVNYGLKFVFNSNIAIKIQKEYKNNKTFFTLDIIQGDISGSAESFGGGVNSIVAILMKFVILTRMKFIKFMILDETTSFVSLAYQERLSLLLKELSKNFGIDILMISHQPKLETHSNISYTLDKINNELKIINTTINKNNNEEE